MSGTALAVRRRSIARSSRAAGFKPRPLQNLFTANGCWAGLLEVSGLRAVKYLCNTCHCRACPSCGKKATDQWIAVQHNCLPDCAWYHLVFTLPDTLWPLFFHQRGLLDALCRLAADTLLYAGQRRGLRIGYLARSTPTVGGSTGIPMCTSRRPQSGKI